MDERLLYDTFSAFGMMATTAKVRVTPQNLPNNHIPDYVSDCSRSWHRSFKRIRVRRIHGFRVRGRGHRIHERTIPHEQSHHGPIRVQKRRKGRTTRNQRREVTRRSSAQEQRVTRQRTATPSSDGCFWCDPTSDAVPRTLSRTICGCFGCSSSTTSRLWSPSGYDATYNGHASYDGNATSVYGYVRCSAAWVYASPTTRVWWTGNPDDAGQPDDASPSPSCHAIV